jgi:glycosidase
LRAWCKRHVNGLVAVIYEIAAISFQDSNGDGYGDLSGLLQRIDYLKRLGVGAVWLTPICAAVGSPLTPEQRKQQDDGKWDAQEPQQGSSAECHGQSSY